MDTPKMEDEGEVQNCAANKEDQDSYRLNIYIVDLDLA